MGDYTKLTIARFEVSARAITNLNQTVLFHGLREHFGNVSVELETLRGQFSHRTRYADASKWSSL